MSRARSSRLTKAAREAAAEKEKLESAEQVKLIQKKIRALMVKKPVDSHAKKLKEYCKTLYTCGWKTISVTYQGSGDSCDDFNFEITNEEKSVDFRDVSTTFAGGFTLKDVEREIWELLPEGFENNEGGSGNVEIDIEKGRITVTHNQYYIESEETVEEY